MQNPPPRIWSSPQTPVRIEYSAGVLREVRLESTNEDASGVLFGIRYGDQVRVLAARRVVDERDPRLAGLDQIGIFAWRVRGKVFLTELDLALLEGVKLTGAIALVVAGSKGGFFVREPDGSMQTIQSYQEFSIVDARVSSEPAQSAPPRSVGRVFTESAQDAAAPSSANVKTLPPRSVVRVFTERPVEPPKLRIEVSRANPWAWIVMGCFAMIAAVVMASPSLLLLLPRPPLGLTVREESGALRIAWNPAAVAQHARLEIVDGAERNTVALSANLASTIYLPRTPEVKILLTASEGQREIAHFVGKGASPSPEVEKTQAQIADLEAEAQTLSVSVEIGRKRLAELQNALSRMPPSGRIQ